MGRQARPENVPAPRVTYADILIDAIRYNLEQKEQIETDAEQAKQANAKTLFELNRAALVKQARKLDTLKTLYRIETGHAYDDTAERVGRRNADKLEKTE